MENIKLKQKVQYLESKVNQRKVNRPNSNEIMKSLKRDSGEKSRYSSHGNIQIADEDRQTYMKEIFEDHQNKTLVKSYSGATSKEI